MLPQRAEILLMSNPRPLCRAPQLVLLLLFAAMSSLGIALGQPVPGSPIVSDRPWAEELQLDIQPDPSAGQVLDFTRAFSLNGLVQFRLPSAMAYDKLGAASSSLWKPWAKT